MKNHLPNNFSDEDKEFQICRMLLQFYKHGAVVNFEIYILEDFGYITSERKHFPPIKEDVSVSRLTPLGLKQVEIFKQQWRDIYVPKYELTGEIPDQYKYENAHEYFWGYSLERLEKERSKGVLAKAIGRSL